MNAEFRLLFSETVRTPRAAADRLMAMDLPREALWTLFWLIVVIGTFLQILGGVQGAVWEANGGPTIIGLIGIAADSALTTGLVILGIWRGGQVWGGHGTLPQTAALYLYLQAFSSIIMLGLAPFLLLLPDALALGAVLAVIVWCFWIHLCFVDELHGFGSLLKAFMLTVAVGIGMLLLQTLLFTLFNPGG